MKNLIRTTTQILLLSTLLSSCLSIKIESNRDKDYEKEIKKIFVVLKGSKDITSFINELEKHFNKYFAERNISIQIFKYDPLSLTDDESQFKSQIDEYGPDVVLYIIQKEGYKIMAVNQGGGTYNNGYNAVFEATIKDIPSAKTVWKSSINIETSGFLTNMTMGGGSLDFSKNLIQRLEKDKLINGVVVKEKN